MKSLTSNQILGDPLAGETDLRIFGLPGQELKDSEEGNPRTHHGGHGTIECDHTTRRYSTMMRHRGYYISESSDRLPIQLRKISEGRSPVSFIKRSL